MSSQSRTVIVIAVVIFLIAIVLWVWLNAQTTALYVTWSPYKDYGSPDAAWISIYQGYDSTQAQKVGIVPVSETLFVVYDIPMDGRVLYTALTATDTANNESIKSDFVAYELPLWDGEPPVEPLPPVVMRPNPASDHVVIAYAVADTLYIYNVLGQLVHQLMLPEGGEYTYMTGTLPTGVYFYRIGLVTGKFTVAR
jgi:hypothetical protein